jgi:RNA polymerase sigma-54 factor
MRVGAATMKQGLQLRIGHQLSMTPQLQQAIKLLQLSSLDLHLEIQQALYSNPMLELAEEIDQANDADNKDDLPEPLSKNQDDVEWSSEIPDELPVDAQWEDIYTDTAPATPGNSSTSNTTSNSTESRNLDEFHSATESLQDHLLWQLNLTPVSDVDRVIASTIIDNISDSGFMETPIEELWESIYASSESQNTESQTTLQEDSITLDEVIAVLHPASRPSI